MKKIIEIYFISLKLAIGLLLFSMVVLVFGNVVLRYVFNTGLAPAEEISRWFFVWLVFLGAILGMRDHSHLGVDMLVRALPRLGRTLCFALSHGLMICACVLLVIGSWQQTIINLGVVAPASGLPMALFYGVGLVFGMSTLGILVAELARLMAGRLRDEDLVSVQESEDVLPEAGRSSSTFEAPPPRRALYAGLPLP